MKFPFKHISSFNFIIALVYSFIVAAFCLYSFALVDPNLTFINHPLWAQFREWAVNLGYHNRGLSWNIYLTLVILLFFFHIFFLRHYQKYNPLKLAIIIGVILFVSYPFLSHDFFNYMFDARILTLHHSNPYTHKALDFPTDPWLRFLQWTHRTYPYGPTWLPLTLIPSFLSLGKFILSYLFFKGLFVSFYITAVYYLQKMDKKWAFFFATQPLVIIEGLINNHNDLIAVSLAIMGVYFLTQKRTIPSRLLLLASAGIKYLTLPLVILQTPHVIAIPYDSEGKKQSQRFGRIFNFLAAAGLIAVIVYLSIVSEIQPWYFLALFALIPYGFDFIQRLNLFFLGLLLSYYPYIALGGWAKPEYVIIKHNIIIFFILINTFQLILNRKKQFDVDKKMTLR